METAELVQALCNPAAYPFEVAEVGFLETHISLLFFAGSRVYKVKKPVDLGFLDFSTLEQRRRMCAEEVRLNRRLAPDTYLGVVEIRRDAGGALRVGGPGELVEPAVEMRRLPAERMLDALLERGEVDNQLLHALAALLARFHAEAATGPGVDEHGTPEAVAANVRENFDQTRRFIGSAPATVSSVLHGFLERRAEGFLSERRELLERRVREGRIRDGHGDLHAGNVCFPAERIVIYDCIEFSARYRCSDAACDLAFLAMDLDLRGFRGFSRYLEHAYAEEAGDGGLAELMPFYKEYRAIVRAKVGSILAADEGVDRERREAARLVGMRYWHLAASYGLGPALIVMCGLPGSGKSWAAREIARPFGAAVLSSDGIRKRLAGVPRTARPRPDRSSRDELYSTAMTDRTYRALLAEAERQLAAGRTVVADATFASLQRRADARALAQRMGVPFVVVHVTASEGQIRERMERRRSDPHEVSDADFAVYRAMQQQFQPPDEVPPAQRVELASGEEAPEEATARVVESLVARSG